MMRALRLAGLGSLIGIVAALVAAVAGGLLVGVLAALIRAALPAEFTDPEKPLALWRAAVLSHTFGLAAAGTVAGACAALLRASGRVDWRAWASCLGAGLTWGYTSALVASTDPRLGRTHTALWLLVASLGVGALVALALWTPVVTAIAQSPSPSVRPAVVSARRIWAGARRLAAFIVALLAIVAAAPLAVVVVGVLVRAAMGQLPRVAWIPGAAACLATTLALAAAVLGLRLAGVPRRWPQPAPPADATRGIS